LKDSPDDPAESRISLNMVSLKHGAAWTCRERLKLIRAGVDTERKKYSQADTVGRATEDGANNAADPRSLLDPTEQDRNEVIDKISIHHFGAGY